MTRKKFYILSCTWGLPLTLVGFAAALFLLATGHRPRRWGNCWYFIVGKKYWGGLNLGPIFFTDKLDHENTKCHEHGHAIQNCFLGPLMIPLVLCSSIRYHYINYLVKRGLPTPDYDAWWFEGQATSLGEKNFTNNS